MRVTVKYIPNILEDQGRETKEIHIESLSPVPLITVLDASKFEVSDYRIILNGQKVDCIEGTHVPDLTEIIITSDIQVGAVVAAAKFIFSSFVSNWGTWLTLAGTAYSVYSALNTPSLPNFGTNGSGLDDGSPSSGWDGVVTTQDVGLPIAVVFGAHRLGGNIINQFVTNDGDKSYLNILLGLAEGEIESISQIKINDNPIENFSGIQTFKRYGTSNQDVIPNFEDLHNVINVGANLTKDNSYIYTTIDNDVEAFEINLSLPQGLFQQDSSSGSILSWSVSYRVEYKLTTSSTWTDLGVTTISGTLRTALRRVFRKDGLSPGKYDIRITRVSDNSSLSPARTGDLTLQSVDEIKTDDLCYPNLALLGIKALATDQLSGSTPNITVLVKGTKVSVPRIIDGFGEDVDWDDYYWDPVTSEYKLFSDDTVLSWDGSTYVDKYSANPIWCLKHLLTSYRFGLGDLIDAESILDSEYLSMSRICDQRVEDGESGYEKLYRLDVAIDSSTKALDLINQLVGSFDAFDFYSEGAVRFKIDEDSDPVQHFGMGNIIADSVSMEWKSKKNIYNMIQVQFADQDKDYRLETISVIDDESLSVGNPLRKKEIRLHTTKKSYALRAARRALNTAKLINRSFSFKVGIDALAIAPGDVIGFSHDVPQIGFSGRIKPGSSQTSIQLDQSVTIESNQTYKLTVQFDDDSIEERIVTNTPGETNVLTVFSGFSQTPNAFDKYAFGRENIHYKRLRVLSLSLDDDLNAMLQAIEMDSGVYDFSAPIIPQDKYSVLSTEIQDVSNLTLSEMVILSSDGSLKNTIEVWWQKPIDASYYLNAWKKARVYLSDDNGVSWSQVGEVEGEHFVIGDNIVTGRTYKVAVVSVSQNDMANAIATSPQAEITIQGKEAPPSDVQHFDVSQAGDKLRFSFDPIPDGDLARYIIKKGSEWQLGTIIGERIDATEFEYPVGEVGEQTYMIKAIDTSGNESNSVSIDTITVTPPPEMNFVQIIDPWAQNREYNLQNIDRVQLNLFDTSYTRDVFVLQTDQTWEDIEDLNKGWDQLVDDGDLEDNKTVVSNGSIEQVESVDLGSVFEFNVISELLYKNVSGGSIQLQMSYSEDNILYTSFENIDAAQNYRARYLKFKYLISSTDSSHNVYFYAGKITINAPLVKTDYGRDVLISASGTIVRFRDDFTTEPRITGLSIVNGVRGIVEVESKNELEMLVKVWDPATSTYIGTAEIDWEVKGT